MPVFWVEERASTVAGGESQYIGWKKEPVYLVKEKASVLG